MIEYLIKGVIFVIFLDIIAYWLSYKGIPIIDRAKWNWNIRLLSILFWPIAAFWFSLAFIEAYFKK
tara:strand:+ start:597 stop:794 length:198 start_codon:yes stop_codon:yes gene_type:complete